MSSIWQDIKDGIKERRLHTNASDQMTNKQTVDVGSWWSAHMTIRDEHIRKPGKLHRCAIRVLCSPSRCRQSARGHNIKYNIHRLPWIKGSMMSPPETLCYAMFHARWYDDCDENANSAVIWPFMARTSNCMRVDKAWPPQHRNLRLPQNESLYEHEWLEERGCETQWNIGQSRCQHRTDTE